MASVHQTFQLTPDGLAAAIKGASDGSLVARSLLQVGLDAYRRDLTQGFIGRYGRIVQTGIFRGMELPEESSWGDGDQLPKLLGSYEMELHPVLEHALVKEYPLVVNVGCAEGYYAIGVARRLSSARVCAFDISEAAQQICAAAARINHVEDRVEVYGRCCAETLGHLLGAGPESRLFVDCEGAEIQLLRPDLVPSLGSADMLIECHDFRNPAVTARLVERFSATHEIERICEGARCPTIHPYLQTLTGLERALATCEFRPTWMHWLFCASRSTNRPDSLWREPHES
jgi:hypothetical protein